MRLHRIAIPILTLALASPVLECGVALPAIVPLTWQSEEP
jgi:hypothetical protein